MQQRGDKQEPEVAELYTDAFEVTTTPFGVNMTFGVREPHPAPNKPQSVRELAIVRMSLEHAKVMTMLLRRQLKVYESDVGVPIKIPSSVYTQLGIAEEDWGF